MRCESIGRPENNERAVQILDWRIEGKHLKRVALCRRLENKRERVYQSVWWRDSFELTKRSSQEAKEEQDENKCRKGTGRDDGTVVPSRATHAHARRHPFAFLLDGDVALVSLFFFHAFFSLFLLVSSQPNTTLLKISLYSIRLYVHAYISVCVCVCVEGDIQKVYLAESRRDGQNRQREKGKK